MQQKQKTIVGAIALTTGLSLILFTNMVYPNFTSNGQYSNLSEFLVQKVCVSSTGQVLAIDPYDCNSNNVNNYLRSLQNGESLPYHKHDIVNSVTLNPDGFQQSDSFPLASTVSGSSVYVSTMRLSAGATLAYQAAQSDFNPDGYNLISTSAGVANYYATKDSTGTAQFFGANCNLNNSWFLFPMNLLAGVSTTSTATQIVSGSTIATLKLLRDGVGCDSNTVYDKSFTQYKFQDNFTYTSGKVLPTIMTTHYGTASVSATAAYPGAGYEVDYFTPLYGLSRWEGWVRADEHCPQAAVGSELDLRCHNTSKPEWSGCNGLTRSADGLWLRWSCRDWTYISTKTAAGNALKFSPYSVRIDSATLATPNFLKNSDMTDSALSWVRKNGLNNGVPVITNWSLIRDMATNRRSLAISCESTTTCFGARILQQFPVSVAASNLGSKFNFGLQAWVLGVANANMTITLIQSNGITSRVDSFTATVNNDSELQYWAEVQKLPGVNYAMWGVYPTSGNTDYRFTNAWVVLK